MNFQDAVLILGYNNTRINDVNKIKKTAKSTLNALTVLCKKSPTPEDRKIADFVIDIELNGDLKNLTKLLNETKRLSINIVAVLPFSDPGTQIASKLALHLGLKGPDIYKVNAALDKYAFRQAEKNAKTLPTGYKPTLAEKIESFDQLRKIYNQLKGNVFLKPSLEGNSRGCINLQQQSSLEEAWTQMSDYVNSGIIAEELVSHSKEYSWEHVSGFSWVTEKETTQNQYRAEVQQIVPAPLSETETNLISNSGKLMSILSGSNYGACHNEVFYSKTNQSVRGVEPNLRPAGMRIWDLATLAYENFDPWKEWLLWAAQNSKQEHTLKKLTQKCFAGVRMISAREKGILQTIPDIVPNTLSTDQVELAELVWTKSPKDLITDEIKDNSDFIGYIIATSKNHEVLISYLEKTTKKLAQEVEIYDFCS